MGINYKIETMKRFIICLSLFIALGTALQAQPYKNAIGLGIDFGHGTTFFGPTLKHFLDANNAFDVSALFANRTTLFGATYQYHGPLSNNILWYLGGGPTLGFNRGTTSFYLRPVAGLDLKVNNAPLAISFDWRPLWYLGDGGNDFNANRFQMGFKIPF